VSWTGLRCGPGRKGHQNANTESHGQHKDSPTAIPKKTVSYDSMGIDIMDLTPINSPVGRGINVKSFLGSTVHESDVYKEEGADQVTDVPKRMYSIRARRESQASAGDDDETCSTLRKHVKRNSRRQSQRSSQRSGQQRDSANPKSELS
jgi:hypothetical protein